MGVGTLLLGAALLLPAGPDAAHRLAEAVRKTRLEEARSALADLAKGDGVRAARLLVHALPRARARLRPLLVETLNARLDAIHAEETFLFELDRARQTAKAVASAKASVQKASRRAIEGEELYDALREAFGTLEPGAAEEVARALERTRSWLLKCELLEALGRMNATWALEAALERETEPVVLAAALRAGTTDRALEFLDHPHWQVRLAALGALRDSREAVGHVIGSLGTAGARYRNEAVAGLAELTGVRLPSDPAAWRAWWKANGEDFLSGRLAQGYGRRLPGPGRTTFYGVPLLSTRICFVVDRSLSMKEKGRLEKAKKELNSLLEHLPNGSLVSIIFFGEETVSLSNAPIPLDRFVRQRAASFINRQRCVKATDLHGALEKALTFVGSPERGCLREDGVDTIVVLSDGKATVGRVVDDELLGRAVARRSRYLGPVIHAIGISSGARSLEVMAKLTGGVYRVR